MKEVACAVCGAMYRFPAAEIPPAGKTVTCAKCKARIVVHGEAAGAAGDVIDLADLPAPRRAAAPTGRGDAGALPPIKGRAPAPAPIVDLPAPRARAAPREPEPFTLDGVDLVAPVGPSARPAAPFDQGPPAIVDLPAPRAPTASDLFDDLPAPRGPTLGDLPAPKRPAGMPDLPAPKRPAGMPDLPAPKRPAGPAGAAAAKPAVAAPPPVAPPPTARPAAPGAGLVDLPAPKGFFDDLPGPAHTGGTSAAGPARADLPAPKGFFDDLPGPAHTGGTSAAGPARADLPAPKGFFDDLPQPATGGGALPAPKGFFDDLPQPATGGGARGDLPAPKGFFDDLPQPVGATATLELPSPLPNDLPPPAGRPGPSDSLALFDDLPPAGGDRAARFPQASGIDLDAIELPSGASGMLELESTTASARSAFDAGPARSHAASDPPPLELGDGDLGLELPSMPAPAGRSGGGVVSFKSGGSLDEPRGAAAPGPAADLDLAVPSRRDPSTVDAKAKAKARPEASAPAAKLSPRATRIALAAALGLAAVGAGGFYMYRRWDAQKARAAEIDTGLASARKALAGNEPGHWRRAGRAAAAVLALNPRHAEALGIAAESALAGYLDEGTDGPGRIAAGRRALDTAARAGVQHPAVERATGLRSLIDDDAAGAVKTLAPLAARGDRDAQLYLGWAQARLQAWPDAVAAFTAATATRPALATLGLAEAQAASGDTPAAHASYLKVIELEPERVSALIGEVMTAPATDFSKREASLLAILQRKDIDQADPRAVVLAWTRAGDEARRGGRLDAARDRYRNALALAPADRQVLVALAATELADGKLDAAGAASDQALAMAPDDVEANLVAAELELRRGLVAEAATRLTALRERQPPIASPPQLARLDMIDGMRLEEEQHPEEALAAYDRAAANAGAGDVGPVIAGAMVLGALATKADADKQPARAAELRAQADARLTRLGAEAETSPTLAITLGVAYLAAGDAAAAERWLRSAIDQRPADVEARFQLAEALRRQGKQDEALAILTQAFEREPTRIDLGVELARSLEAAGRDADAAALYKKLLASPGVTVETQARAGRFFARTGDLAAAGELGTALLAVTPDDPTGLFLKGEGLLLAGKLAEARRAMQDAANRAADPQFLDGLGRAAEAYAKDTNDTAIRDEALRAYDQATTLAPTMLNPWIGVGRIRLARGEYDKALTAYQAALRLAPRDPDIPYGIGLAYAELDEDRLAIQWLARAVAIQPRADALYRLGSLYFDADQAGSAASALERATAMATKDERDTGATVPWLTDALWMLGTVQQVRRDDRAAVRAWSAYLDRKPTNQAQADEVRRFLLTHTR
ncbi:MAG: tetratricopeptide repeat protein [Kofleriaceae bacterium]